VVAFKAQFIIVFVDRGVFSINVSVCGIYASAGKNLIRNKILHAFSREELFKLGYAARQHFVGG
jgi:hypothetical protein